MKIAVSSIAWSPHEEAAMAKSLQDLSVRSVEVASTKVFANPTGTTAVERADYSRFWADYGITIVAFQCMLFGLANLQVFGDDSIRRETVDVLSRFIELAGALGAGRLVFGSPKNRVVPGTPGRAATDVAAAVKLVDLNYVTHH